jgi:hypothetical protein
MTTAFVVVLTFAFGTINLQQPVLCPDLACVHRLEEGANASPALARFRAWAFEDYSPLDTPGRAFRWPPFLDWTKG